MELFGDQEPPIPPQSSTSISKWKSSLAIEPSQPKPPSSSSSSLLLAKTLPEFLVNQNNGFDLLNMMNDGKRLIVSYKNTDNINSNNNNNNNNDIHKQKRNENEQTSINSNKNNNNNNNTPNNIEPKKIRDSSSPPSLIDVDDLVMINA
ncbi:hypothetical protein QR98_0067680 [Sarcoptes scabiei]|uniref:Uncharacterized protein n=1 Tax=Sarcoptes scabiei TaxID=52283 RepID=A0A132AB88_SARSC|nr:hypothetical protein QR98_0067680 [Sarcoptes scabiei]